MYDPAPFLSLVDASSTELELSSVSATTSVTSSVHPHGGRGSDRLEKLEREVLNRTRRLEEEAGARKRMQDLLAEAGIKVKPNEAE